MCLDCLGVGMRARRGGHAGFSENPSPIQCQYVEALRDPKTNSPLWVAEVCSQGFP